MTANAVSMERIPESDSFHAVAFLEAVCRSAGNNLLFRNRNKEHTKQAAVKKLTDRKPPILA